MAAGRRGAGRPGPGRGSGWGVYITAPALLPVPLSGDPLEDGGTDIAAIFVAVTDGRKAAVQQLEAPGDLSDPAARAAAAESAALQAVSLLLGPAGRGTVGGGAAVFGFGA